ncbi:MAG: VOC family protein [Paracoccaceae bacterium]
MILGIHHAAISTPDLDRALAFYCDLLGFTVASRMDWPRGTALPDTILGVRDTAARQAKLRAGNCFLEIFEFSSPPPRSHDRAIQDHGITHLCLHVRDLEAEVARLQAAGITFRSDPQLRPTHASVYGHDPDGNVLELLEVMDDSHPFSFTTLSRKDQA